MKNTGQSIAQITETLSALSVLSEKLPDLILNASNTLEMFKRGEVNAQTVQDAYQPIVDAVLEAQTKTMKTSCEAILGLTLSEYRQSMMDDWEKAGCVFGPKTPLEQDIWDHFHECKKDGYRFAVMYSDSFTHTWPCVAVAQGKNPHEALEELNRTEFVKPMVILDTSKDFQEQWPYISGMVFSPLTLTSNPVISLPEDARNHPNLRKLMNRPKYIMGIVQGGQEAHPVTDI